ncbi:hypothetical protein ACHAXS_003110 [Conticribra weissflogii]
MTLATKALGAVFIGALSLIPATFSQEVTLSSYACYDPTMPAETAQLYRGRNTTVCLYAGPGGDWNTQGATYTRFAFNLKADEFSSYWIPGSFKSIVQDNPFNSNATHVFASSQSSPPSLPSRVSFLRRYYDATTKQVFPYLTAVIDVKDGTVQGIAWDDACIFCNLSRCLPNTYDFVGNITTRQKISQPTDGCYISRDECVALHSGGSDECDLKLFVVWTGTGVGGTALFSSDSRFSAFPPNRIQENVENGVNQAIGNLQDQATNAKDTVDGFFDSVTGSIPFYGDGEEDGGEDVGQA